MITPARFLIVALLTLGLGGMRPLSAVAATTVRDCPTSQSALSSDITSAGSGGTVLFTCSSATTIPFTTFITISQDVALDASSAGGTVTFDGGGTTSFFRENAGVSFSLKHLTLQHGTGGYGGAIFTFNSTLTITSSTLSDNSAISGGGAIDNDGSTITITNSTFSGNSTNGGGLGGVILNYGTITITNSTLSGNSASSIGGAIDNHGSVIINNSTLSGNSSSSIGGAIYNHGSMTITNSTLSGNSAGSGGAIDNYFGTLTISDSTLSGNSALLDGGAIGSSGTLTITNSTFPGNSARYYGGAIYNYFGSALTITTSTFSGNSAGQTGDAIYNDGATTTIGGSIVANSTHGGNCAGTSITDEGYNLSDDSSCGFSTANHDLLNTNPQLGALRNNGGPTPTMALAPTSPAIDQIPIGTAPLCPGTGADQRGDPRPDAGESRCDIGAYESSYTPTVSSPHAVVTVLASTPCTTILANVTTLPSGTAVGKVVGLDERPGGIPCAPTRPAVVTIHSVTITSLVCTSHTTASVYGQAMVTTGTGSRSIQFRLDVVWNGSSARINGTATLQTSSGYTSGAILATVHIAGC